MKTVKDVYAEYKEWPHNGGCICLYDTEYNTFRFWFNDYISVGDVYEVCIREEFEQYKAEQESKDMKADWYNYDKQEWDGKNIPDKGSLVLLNDSTVSVVLHDSKLLDQVCVRHLDGELSIPKIHWLKPLDHDKYKVKVAAREWMIECGLDAEFSDSSDSDWFIGKLTEICNNSPIFKYKDGLATWKHCRPRMNHNHVLTREQFELIPNDVFNITQRYLAYSDDELFIVEFTGLKDGYVWECE